MKKLKFGFVKLSDAYGSYTFKVLIKLETNDFYYVKYLEETSDNYTTNIYKNRLQSKHNVFSIYEKELNWFQRLFI